jgi:hypothetical protein
MAHGAGTFPRRSGGAHIEALRREIEEYKRRLPESPDRIASLKT